jgi:hypothetical protein
MEHKVPESDAVSIDAPEPSAGVSVSQGRFVFPETNSSDAFSRKGIMNIPFTVPGTCGALRSRHASSRWSYFIGDPVIHFHITFLNSPLHIKLSGLGVDHGGRHRERHFGDTILWLWGIYERGWLFSKERQNGDGGCKSDGSQKKATGIHGDFLK